MAVKDTVELGRSIFDLARSLAIVLLVIVLVAWPNRIDKILEAVGIQEFEFFGLKGKTSLVDLAQQLRDQQTASTALKQQLSDNIEVLNAVQQERNRLVAELATLKPGNTARPLTAATDNLRSIQQAIEHATDAITVANSVAQVTSEVLSTNASTITAAQTAVGGSGSWAVIFSGDPSEAAALPEIERVRKSGVASPRLYLRQRSYRGAAPFPSQSAAQAKLAAIRALSPNYKDAYVVNLEIWCPNPVQTPSGVLDCGL